MTNFVIDKDEITIIINLFPMNDTYVNELNHVRTMNLKTEPIKVLLKSY
jgi:hypothetical protein